MMQAMHRPFIAAWRTSGGEKPLSCWRGAQLDALANAFDAALHGWRLAWGLDGAAGAVCRAATPADVQPGGWTPLGVDGASMAWRSATPSEHPGIRRALFPRDGAAGELAAGLIARCMGDAAERLAAVLEMQIQEGVRDPPADASFAGWSGSVIAALPPPLGERVLLNAEAMRSWVDARKLAPESPSVQASRQAMVSTSQALADHPLALGVELGSCELDLGTLQQLRPGDVVRLAHALHTPAAVVDGAGACLFHGFLGRRQGRKAVELAAAATAAIPDPVQELRP